MLRLATLMLLLVGACVPSVRAQSELEKLEQMQELKTLLRALEKSKRNADEAIQVKAYQCMNAIGDKSFCDCIASHLPGALDFRIYVSILSQTKTALKYEKRSSRDRVLIDNARMVREICVNARTP